MGGVVWFLLVRHRNQWLVIVNNVINLQASQKAGNFSINWATVSFWGSTQLRGISSIKRFPSFTVELPVVLRKRSNASGTGGAAEATVLKWLHVRECPWYRRSGRESDATEVEAVEEIKYFYIFARIALVHCCCCSLSSTRKRQVLESCVFRIL
jgi:hypothetical protein